VRDAGHAAHASRAFDAASIGNVSIGVNPCF
jgi:hypothetical protein